MEITYETLKDRTKKRILEEMIRSVRPSNGLKVVVVDANTLRIISAACTMIDITEEGVSLVENISLERQPLPNMEAVYFLSTAPSSIDALIADFKNPKQPQYKAIHLFFIKRVPEEELKKIKASNVLPKVKTFKEMNLDFIAFEQQAFHFDSPESFQVLFAPEGGQKGVEFKSIADKLVSVCATLGDYPTIRYSINKESGSFAQTIASVLQERLDDLMRSSPDYQNKANLGANRASLLILDRSFDPISPLLHEFTYQAMVYDLLDVKNDRYKFTSQTASGENKNREVALGEADALWPVLRHMHIAEANEWLIDNFNTFLKENKAIDAVKGKKVGSLSEMNDAARSLPQFQKLLGKFSLHMGLATSVMDVFNQKNLSKIAGTEQDMATGEDVDGKSVKNVMSNVAPILSDANVSSEDKLRLMMLYIISQEGIKDSDRKRLMDLAKISFEDQSCISNLRYLGVTLMKTTKGQKKKAVKDKKKKNRDDAPSYDLSRYVPQVKDLAEGMIENTLSASEFPFIKEPVNMDDVSKSKAAPTSKRTTKVSNVERKSEKVAVTGGRIIIFICGGMSFSEMRTAYELTKKYNREVIIGSTAVLTPESFVSALRALKKVEKADDDY